MRLSSSPLGRRIGCKIMIKKSLFFITVFLLLKINYAHSFQTLFSIGNKYAYQGERKVHHFPSEEISFLDQIISETTLNGNNYFIFNRSKWTNKSLWPSEDTNSTTYRRADSNSIYEFNLSKGTEDTLIKFNDSIGTIYYSSGYYLNEKHMLPFFDKEYMMYTVGPIEGTSHTLNKTYSPRIYLTNYLNGGVIEIFVNLKGAIINGVLYGDSPLLSVRNESKINLNRDYTLYQNYPNPFNPATRISFSLTSQSLVTLKVFDVLGRDIATIISEEMSAGNYSKQWNAVNFPSGIYYYQLQAGSYTATKKMILLK